MSDNTAQYLVEVQGPSEGREQLLATLRDLESEATRQPQINVDVKRVKQEQEPAEFQTANE